MSQTLSGVLISGTFTGTGPSSTIASFYEYFNITVSGTFVGTVALERSFDRGQTWHPIARDLINNPLTFSAPTTVVGFEPENGVFYRLNCTAFSSGTINWRISQ